MSGKVERRIGKLLDEAAARESCVGEVGKTDRQALRRRVKRGEIACPLGCLYARRPRWESLDRTQKALWVMRGLRERNPNWVYCGVSAAAAHGLPVSHDLLGSIYVATSARAHSRGGYSWLERRIVERDKLEVRSGVRVTSLLRTTFDCLRELDIRDALPIADATAGRLGMTGPAMVERFVRDYGGLPGLRHAINTARYADGRSESGGESLARAVMIVHGLALPELQAEFPDPAHLGERRRVDFVWRRADGGVVIGEFDGYVKYEDEVAMGGRSLTRVLLDERHRESDLTLYADSIVRFTYPEVKDEEHFIQKLRRHGIGDCAPGHGFEPVRPAKRAVRRSR